MNESLKGGEMVTATVTLSRSQWAIVILLLHQSMPMLPSELWRTSDFIADTIKESIDDALG